MTFAINRNRLTLQINGDPRTLEKVDELLTRVEIERTIAAGSPGRSEQIIYHLAHEFPLKKAEGVLETAQALTAM